MICFEYEDFHLYLTKLEGRQYDDRSVPLTVTGTFPEGYTWQLLLAFGENLNIIEPDVVADGLYHLLTAEELAFSGRYTVQLSGTKGDEVRHTNTVNLFIPASLSGNTQWPELPTVFSDALAEAKALVPAGGTTGQVLAKASDAERDYEWKTVGGISPTDYLELTNKPLINGTELSGDLKLNTLPEPTAEDNGKIAKIVNGQWTIAEDLKLSIKETSNPEGGNTLTIGG